MSTICQSVLDYKAVKHVVPNQSNHLNCHSVTAVFTKIYDADRHFKKTILSKSLSVVLHLNADNIIPFVHKAFHSSTIKG